MRHVRRVWDDVDVGSALEGYSLLLTFSKVAQTQMATWDFFPGHHDPDFARAQGQKDIYLNTIALQGFVDRVVTDWGGPETFIRRRKMMMIGSAFPGDMLTGSGIVRGKSVKGEQGCVDLDLTLATESGLICKAETTAILPFRAGGENHAA